MMQAPAGCLAPIADGRVVRTDRAAGASMSLGEIANGLSTGARRRAVRAGPGLSAEGWFHVDQQVYPSGFHAAMVRVDRETGAVTVERYIIGYDIGRAINPTLVRGQIVGELAKASAVRCWRSSPTVTRAIRCRRRWRTT